MSVIIEDTKLKDIGIRVLLDSEYPATPSTRDKTLVIPGTHGEYDFGAEFGKMPHDLECRTFGSNHADIQNTARKLKRLLLDQYGKPKMVKLTYEFEPEKYYNVRLSGNISIDRLVVMGDFSLPLVAYDPWAYAPAEYYDPDFVPSYNTDEDYNSGSEYKNQTFSPFNNTKQYVGIYNYSHYATPFSFVIEGYVVNPKITNTTSGKSLQMNLTVQANEKLYVDSKLKTTWKVSSANDVYYWLTPSMMTYGDYEKINAYNDKTGDFLELVSGGNTLLFEGGLPDASITFDWKHRFM